MCSKARRLPAVVGAQIVTAEPVSAETYEPSEGQRENVYLIRRMSKFEDRANAALKGSLLLALLAVLAKSGVPLSSALLERAGLPGIGDGRLLTGLLAIVMLVFAGAAGYYVLQSRHHADQMQIPAMRRTWAGDFAQTLLTAGGVTYIIIIVSIASLCLGDMIYAVITLHERLVHTMTGWEAEVVRP